MHLSGLRTVAPIAIAIAVVIVAIVQGPRLGTFSQAASDPRPCEQERAASAAAAGTPVPDTATTEARITTSLIVRAPERGVPMLQPSIRVQTPLPPRKNQQDVMKLVNAFLSDSAQNGKPDWEHLIAVLESTPGEMGLFPQGISIAAQREVAATAQARDAAIPVQPLMVPTQIASQVATQAAASGGASGFPLDETPLASEEAGDSQRPPATPVLRNEVEKIVEDLSEQPHITANADGITLDIPLVTTTLDTRGTWAGAWEAKAVGQTLRFRIAGQPEQAIWNVEFCIEGTQILSVQPLPDSIDDHRAVWRFEPEYPPPDTGVEVVAAAQRASWLHQVILSDGIVAVAVRSWAILAPALLLWIGLWMSRRESIPWLVVAAAWLDLKAMTVAVTRLAILGALALMLTDLLTLANSSGSALPPLRSLDHQLPAVVLLSVILAGIIWAFATVPPCSQNADTRRLVDVAPGGAFLAGVLLLVLALPIEVRWDAIWRAMERALLVTGYLTFLLTAVAMWQRKRGQSGARVAEILLFFGLTGILPCLAGVLTMDWFVQRLPSWLISGVAVLSAVWVTTCVTAGFILMAVALMPPSRQRRNDGAITQVRVLFAAATIIIVVLFQWMMAVYSIKPFSQRIVAEADPRNELPEFLAEIIRQDVGNYLSTFLMPSLNLMPLLGLIGFMTLIAAIGRRTPRANRGVRRWQHARMVLAFIFSAFVVGYGGQVLGLQVPVAFAIGTLLFLTVTADGVRQLLGEVAPRRAPPPPLPPPGPAEGEAQTVNPAAPAATAGAGTPAAPDHSGMTWWEHGRLATHHGSLLAIVPIGYFVVVLLGSQAGGDRLLLSRFIPAGIFTVLAYEVVFWIVAAFVFGATYDAIPGRNGLLKGGVLGLVYLGAHVSASALGVMGDALWQVRSFQLLLFLMVLGVWLDNTTFGVDWRQQLDRSGLPRAIALTRQMLPLLSALAVVMAQLLNNNTQEAINTLISAETGAALGNVFCGASNECLGAR